MAFHLGLFYCLRRIKKGWVTQVRLDDKDYVGLVLVSD